MIIQCLRMKRFAALTSLLNLVISLHLSSGDGGDKSSWKTTTACYGSDNRCSTYKMECPSPQKIALGTLQYGSKPSISICLFGVADCTKTSIICCAVNESDTFTLFSDSDRLKVSENCSGKETCEGPAPRKKDIPYSMYMVMTYTCVFALTTSSTDTQCNGSGVTPALPSRCPTSLEITSKSFSAIESTTSRSAANGVSTSEVLRLSSSSPKAIYVSPSTTTNKTVTSLSTIKQPQIKTIFPSSTKTISTSPASTTTRSASTVNSSKPNLISRSSVSTAHVRFETILSSLSPKAVSKSSLVIIKSTYSNISNKRVYSISPPATFQSITTDNASGFQSSITTTTSAYPTTEYSIVPTKDDDGIDKGLVIGLIIGILAALAIIVAVIVCLCIRIKRKEKYRRNYVRNTNIFYSFPEDLKDMESTLSDCKSVEIIERDDEVIIQANDMYEPFDGIESPYHISSIFDAKKYMLHHQTNSSSVVILPEDANSHESSTDSNNEDCNDETKVKVEIINANESSYTVVANDNGVDTDKGKTCETKSNKPIREKPHVKFDPSALYATVDKVGRTKF